TSIAGQWTRGTRTRTEWSWSDRRLTATRTRSLGSSTASPDAAGARRVSRAAVGCVLSSVSSTQMQEVSLKFPRLKLSVVAALRVASAVSAAIAQQPTSPPPAAQAWPDLSGTWKGTWGGAPTTLVIFKRSESVLVGRALGGMSGFAQSVVGQNDSDVTGT